MSNLPKPPMMMEKERMKKTEIKREMEKVGHSVPRVPKGTEDSRSLITDAVLSTVGAINPLKKRVEIWQGPLLAHRLIVEA